MCELRDLRAEVTVFVTTVGAPSFDECLDSLRRQDTRFALQIIDHVAPLSAAFQRMLDTCTTPFYVQVDEDMLLHPHAVRTLHERITAAGDQVAVYVCSLYDAHLERCISGIRIFRHAVTSRYPFRDVEGCEWDQVARLQRDGFEFLRHQPEDEVLDSPNTLGLHGTHWAPRTIYERFRTYERKRCRGNVTHAWFTAYPRVFLDRFLEQGSELDFFALMGLIAGRLSDHTAPAGEKDFRRYDSVPGFDSIRRFLEQTRDVGKQPDGDQ